MWLLTKHKFKKIKIVFSNSFSLVCNMADETTDSNFIASSTYHPDPTNTPTLETIINTEWNISGASNA